MLMWHLLVSGGRQEREALSLSHAPLESSCWLDSRVKSCSLVFPLTEQLFDVAGIETLAELLENCEGRFKPLASWCQLPFLL